MTKVVAIVRGPVLRAARFHALQLFVLLLAACGDSGQGQGDAPMHGGHEGSNEPVSSGAGGSPSSPGDAPTADDAGTPPMVAATGDAKLDAATAPAGAASGQPTQREPVDAGPPTPTEYETAKALVGSYAAMIQYRDVITVGLAGMGSLITTVLATAEIKEDAASKSVRLAMDLCEARVGAPTKHLLDLDINIPKTALSAAHLGPVVLRATRTKEETTWKADELYGVAGWKSSSATDELPKQSNDPRLLDQDSDGNPGVTATFSGHAMGTLYLGLSYRFLLSGSVSQSGDLSGATTSTSREALLGSSEILLLGTVIERMPDADTADNTVRLVRQASAPSCDQLIAQKSALFP